MIRGLSGNIVVSPLCTMGFQCFIHQMKGIIYLCMLIYLIQRINIKVKKYIWKCIFFYFYFSIVHISLNNVFGSLKFCMHVDNISVKGTVSQIFILCQKTSNFLSMFMNIFPRFSKKKGIKEIGPISKF